MDWRYSPSSFIRLDPAVILSLVREMGVNFLGVVAIFLGRETLREAAWKTGHAFHRVPDEFTRYAIYGGIGFAGVFLLFMVSIWVDEAMRRRTRAKEWR